MDTCEYDDKRETDEFLVYDGLLGQDTLEKWAKRRGLVRCEYVFDHEEVIIVPAIKSHQDLWMPTKPGITTPAMRHNWHGLARPITCKVLVAAGDQARCVNESLHYDRWHDVSELFRPVSVG